MFQAWLSLIPISNFKYAKLNLLFIPIAPFLAQLQILTQRQKPPLIHLFKFNQN